MLGLLHAAQFLSPVNVVAMFDPIEQHAALPKIPPSKVTESRPNEGIKSCK